MFAIGDYAAAPQGETPEAANARRNGGRFTLAEAREERAKARALVKQGINPSHLANWTASSADRKAQPPSGPWPVNGSP